MKIVIDIPKEEIKLYQAYGQINSHRIMSYIANGTVLPEHHGRLIDADALKSKMYKHRYLFVSPYEGQSDMPINEKIRVDEISNCIADIVNAPTILEAREVKK